MICEWCRCVFCWDDADEPPPGNVKRYCSTTCQRAARKQRAHQRAVQSQFCVDRPKPEYPDEAAAADAAMRLGREPPLYPYECPRGHWHLSSQPPGTLGSVRTAAARHL